MQEEDEEYESLLKPEVNDSEADVSEADDDDRSWDDEDDWNDEDDEVDDDRSVGGLQDGSVRSACRSQMQTTSPELRQPLSSPLTPVSNMSVDGHDGVKAGQDGVDAVSAHGSPMQTTSPEVGQPSSSPLTSVSHMSFSPLPSAQRHSPASISSPVIMAMIRLSLSVIREFFLWPSQKCGA